MAASAATTPRRDRTSKGRPNGPGSCAWRSKASQLVPYYQPIVDLHSGTIVAVEALARWDDPVRGVVEAKDFIPLAEELGLVGDISELVLSHAALAVNGLGASWRRP